MNIREHSVRAAAVLMAALFFSAIWGRQSLGAEAPEGLSNFLARHRPRYEKALLGARDWLDETIVDPVELRARGYKGKKSMTMLLSTYIRLYHIALEQEKGRLLARMNEVVAATRTADYHDMLMLDNKAFKQDATSYLRAAYLMDGLGMDTTYYRGEIRKTHPRLNAHMPSRGVHQRMAFQWYYDYFDLQAPFPLAVAYKDGVIATRRDPVSMSRMDGYHLTHEIFIPFRFGELREPLFFSEADRAYLRPTLEALAIAYMQKEDPDLTAELSTCMAYLGFTDSAVYERTVEYLLSTQNSDGSWGDYEDIRRRIGDYVRSQLYLHTTGVAIEALIEAFQPDALTARDLENQQ